MDKKVGKKKSSKSAVEKVLKDLKNETSNSKNSGNESTTDKEKLKKVLPKLKGLKNESSNSKNSESESTTDKEKLKKVQTLQGRTDESVRDDLNTISSSHEPSHWPDEDVIDKTLKIKISVLLSRTSFLLHDYREFKAARTIQKAFRGWFARRMIQKKIDAAMVIQRVWRGFLSRRIYFRKLEDAVQERILRHYFHSAQKLQSLWRGFWVRQNVHDQYRMMRMQMRAAEDLLHCVAFKLHHLLRTHQIPGIYSLRNSACLSKVEQLLYAMQFKHFNDRVRMARFKREQNTVQAKHRHKESVLMTEVPYGGPNFEGVCEPKCCELYKEADADLKMSKILSLYAKATRADTRTNRMKKRLNAQQKPKPAYSPGRRTDFCQDVIESMKKWNILGPNKITVNRDIFKTPENVEKFLNEIHSLTDVLKPRCHCHIKTEKLYARSSPIIHPE